MRGETLAGGGLEGALAVAHRHAELNAQHTVAPLMRQIRAQMAGQPAQDVRQELLRQLRTRFPRWTPSCAVVTHLADEIATLPGHGCRRWSCRDS